MIDDYQNTQEFKEKKSISMLWIGCISIVMIFAGLTSAYLVVRSGNFWVKMGLPSWFIISTVIILATSLTFYLALKFAKQNNQKMIKTMMAITLLGGIIFTYSQFKGWNQLIDSGYNLVGKVTADGYYGQHILVTLNGKTIDAKDDGTFEIDNTALSPEENSQLEAYFEALHTSDHDNKDYSKTEVFEQFGLIYKYQDRYRPMSIKDGRVMLQNLEGQFEKSPGLATVLKRFARNMFEKEGFFQMKGTYGEDFTIMYQTVPLEYKNNSFYAQGNMLTEGELANLEDTQNTASSFVYILSGLHLVHLIGGWIYILVVFIASINNTYGAHNYLKIKLGSVYWHFLGGLWVFLYLFLSFIH